jgi:hypothetical protein
MLNQNNLIRIKTRIEVSLTQTLSDMGKSAQGDGQFGRLDDLVMGEEEKKGGGGVLGARATWGSWHDRYGVTDGTILTLNEWRDVVMIGKLELGTPLSKPPSIKHQTQGGRKISPLFAHKPYFRYG